MYDFAKDNYMQFSYLNAYIDINLMNYTDASYRILDTTLQLPLSTRPIAKSVLLPVQTLKFEREEDAFQFGQYEEEFNYHIGLPRHSESDHYGISGQPYLSVIFMRDN